MSVVLTMVVLAILALPNFGLKLLDVNKMIFLELALKVFPAWSTAGSILLWVDITILEEGRSTPNHYEKYDCAVESPCPTDTMHFIESASSQSVLPCYLIHPYRHYRSDSLALTRLFRLPFSPSPSCFACEGCWSSPLGRSLRESVQCWSERLASERNGGTRVESMCRRAATAVNLMGAPVTASGRTIVCRGTANHTQGASNDTLRHCQLDVHITVTREGLCSQMLHATGSGRTTQSKHKRTTRSLYGKYPDRC